MAGAWAGLLIPSDTIGKSAGLWAMAVERQLDERILDRMTPRLAEKSLPSLLLVAFLLLPPARAQDATEAEAQRHFQTAKQAEKSGDYGKAAAEYREVPVLARRWPLSIRTR